MPAAWMPARFRHITGEGGWHTSQGAATHNVLNQAPRLDADTSSLPLS